MPMPQSSRRRVNAVRRVLTAVCACVLLPTAAAAHPILIDQTQPYVPGTGAITFAVSDNVGQTFTPTLDRLDAVELWLMDMNVNHAVTDSLIVSISELNGTLLGSSGPQVFANGYGGGTVALSHFDFAPISLVPGTKYIIGFDVSTSGDYSDLGIAGYDPGTYTGGGLWIWSTTSEHQTADYAFAEGPAAAPAPEPSSVLLLGAGLLGYFGRRHVTRRR